MNVAKLRAGESCEIEVSPGSHRLRIKIDWTGSPELAFSVSAEGVAAFTCAPASGALNVFSAVSRRKAWIALERA